VNQTNRIFIYFFCKLSRQARNVIRKKTSLKLRIWLKIILQDIFDVYSFISYLTSIVNICMLFVIYVFSYYLCYCLLYEIYYDLRVIICYIGCMCNREYMASIMAYWLFRSERKKLRKPPRGGEGGFTYNRGTLVYDWISSDN
jgi:hypothetical protein